MTENIISWNVANWVSVVLMASIGYALFVLISKTIAKTKEMNDD